MRRPCDRFLVAAVLLLAACGGSGGGTSAGSGGSTSPVASQITITGGNNQGAVVGTTLPIILSVQVSSSSGQGISGATVTWKVASGGGSLTSVSTTTDSNGSATNTLEIGTAAGANSVTAAVTALTPVTFTATGTPGPLASMILNNPKNPLATGDTASIVETGADQYDNSVANANPTWTATPSGVVTVSSSGVVTAMGPGAGFVTATSGAIATTLPVVVTGSIGFALGAEEVVFRYSTDACEPGDNPDVPAKAVRLPDGTLTVISGDVPHFYALFGADFSSLKRSCTVPILVSDLSPTASTFDNAQWVHSVYLVGNTINALMHNEYHDPTAANCSPGNLFPGNPCWYNSITYAQSSDGGHTYTHSSPPQPVAAPATQWNPGPPTPAPYGYFNPSNIVQSVDGSYYAVFMSIPSSGTPGMCVMRTQTLGDPTSWRAWDGTGFNLQMANPYTGSGAQPCTPVIPNSEFVASLTFNTYLGAYLLVGDVAVSGFACGTWFYTSTDLVHWSAPAWIRAIYSPVSAGGTGCTPPAGVASFAYSSLIDHTDTTANFEKTGKTVYLYYTRFNAGSSSPDRDLVRVPVTIN